MSRGPGQYLWIFVIAFSTGCASSTPYTIAGDVPPERVAVIDNRPSDEIKGGLPLLNNPTYTVPDARFQPKLLSAFSARLAQEFGEEMESREIIVSRFRVQNYFGASYSSAQASSLAATAVGAGNVGLASYFSAARSGRAIDVVLVEISGTIDGREFNGAGAQPYDAKPGAMYMGMVYDLPESRDATSAAVQQALDAAVESIREK